MKLSLKLPLAFAAALFLSLAAGVVGMLSLKSSLDVFATGPVEAYVKLVQQTRDTESHFKTQVQEWKNTLLRGSKPEELERFWTAFQKQEKAVASSAEKVIKALADINAPAELKGVATSFLAAHTQMAEGYRKGFEAFKALGFDHLVGDAAVKGMDREPAKLLAQLVEAMEKTSDEIGQGAVATAITAFQFSMMAMVSSVLLGIGVGIWISRQKVASLVSAVGTANQVATGDLTGHVNTRGQDELADLNRALATMQTALVSMVKQVLSNAAQLSAASTEIAHGNLDLSERTESQASALQQQAASMGELSATVSHNAQNASMANRMATEASNVASEGGRGGGRGGDHHARHFGQLTQDWRHHWRN